MRDEQFQSLTFPDVFCILRVGQLWSSLLQTKSLKVAMSIESREQHTVLAMTQ